MKKTQTNTSGKLGNVGFSLILVFIVITILDLAPLLRLCIANVERAATKNVGKKIPSLFPVLVVSPDSAGKSNPVIVFYENLPKYLKEHPKHSFTVPANQVEHFNNLLKQYSYDSGYGVGRFTMTQRGGKQFFKVEGTWDDDRVNIGWYEADNRSFTPRRHVWYFGPGLVLMYFPIIILGNLFAAFLIANLAPFVTKKVKENKTGR